MMTRNVASMTIVLAVFILGACGKSEDETARSFVGTWKDPNGMIDMEFRLGKWDEEDEDDPEGDGMGWVTVWAERKPDAEGKRLAAGVGFVEWERVDKGITFKGAVAKGTAVLLDGGKELSVSWEYETVGRYHLRTEQHQSILKRQ